MRLEYLSKIESQVTCWDVATSLSRARTGEGLWRGVRNDRAPKGGHEWRLEEDGLIAEESLAAWLMSLESPCGEEIGPVLNGHECAQTDRTYCTTTPGHDLVSELSASKRTYHFSGTQIRATPR